MRTAAELDDAVRALGLPLILKTAASGYDGKGQIRVDAADEMPRAWAGLGRAPCVAEAWVDFAAEVSVVVARGRDGQAVCYPVGLNRHDRHILDSTMMPAPVGPIVSQEARDMALGVAQALDTVGVLCVEFFLTADGRLLVNEIAPRPHNSGHLTIEAAPASQFEQQVRALCGLPLGDTASGHRPRRWSTCSATCGPRPAASRDGTPPSAPIPASRSTCTASARRSPAARWAT